MNFHFNMLNHSKMGQTSLEDVIGIMGIQMRELGHQAAWETANERFVTPDIGYNVIVEGFTPAVTEVVARAHAQGCRFICIATEEPTPKGFNHGRDPEMRRRQDEFPNAAKYFDGILHLVPGEHVTRWYSQFAPTAYAELGYARKLIREQDFEPTHDFVFFGSLSQRRLNILKRLAKRCGLQNPNAVRVVADFPDQRERDKRLREGKVVVQLRKFEEMGLVSSSRCNTALHCGRPVIAEPHDLSEPWDRIVHFTKRVPGGPEAMINQFIMEAMTVKAAWRSVHRAQLDNLKRLLPPEACIGEPLRRIGIVETEGGRAAA